MRKQDKTKLMEKLEEGLKEYRKLSREHRTGRRWIKEIRQALGMSVTELACRLECGRSLVYRIEEGEARGADRIELMQEVAEAMGCTLVYAIVPKDGETLEKTAKWLRENPQWRTEKQEARRSKEMDALKERMNREHWDWVREKKEERARKVRMEDLAEKLAQEWAVEKAKRDADAAAGRPPAEGWSARWVWERLKAEEAAGKGAAARK